MSGTTSALSGQSVTLESDYLKMSGEAKKQSNLDKDAFLSLLVTQMQYQDPLNPMDNSEMLAQLAQFTALEQMQNVASVNQKQLANTLIGKYVQYVFTDSATGKSSVEYGKVDYVDLSGDAPKLGIGDKTIDLSDIEAVIDQENIQANTTAYDLIGKTVQASAQQKDSNGKPYDIIVEGKVQSVSIENGTTYVVIGTHGNQIKTEFNNVKNIIEKTSITDREVTVKTQDEDGKEKQVTGIVEFISIDENNKYTVSIDGKMYDYEDIISVK